MKRLIIAVLLILALCGCEDTDGYPRLYYYQTAWENSCIGIELKDGYTLNAGHMYDIIDTEQGYDLVLHFVKEDNE